MIRRLHTSDIENLLKLWRDVNLPHRPEGRDQPESLQSQMEIDPDVFWGYFDELRLVGTIVITHDGRKGWINRLAVHPEYRQKGIGKDLISFAETLLEQKGIKIIAALIESDNTPSITLFNTCGFDVCTDIVYLRKPVEKDI